MWLALTRSLVQMDWLRRKASIAGRIAVIMQAYAFDEIVLVQPTVHVSR
jgi:hypothetical protein